MKILYARSAELAHELKSMTFNTLREMLPHVRKVEVPRGDYLRDGKALAVPLFMTGHKRHTITVYQPGFFLYTEPGEATACAVWKCPEEIFNYVTDMPIAGQEEILNFPWFMVLAAAGRERVLHNQDSREDSHIDFYFEPGTVGWSTMPHEMDTPETVVLRGEGQEALHVSLTDAENDLTPLQKAVISLHYNNGKTLVEIAEMFGVKPPTICRAHRRALKNLKAGILARGLM